MLDRIKQFFATGGDAGQDREAALHLAAALLLVEVAKADHAYDEREVQRVRDSLAREWTLSESELDDLVAVAEDRSEEAVSLHDQVAQINGHFSPRQKFDLVRGLWSVACADGEIHPQEELLVRRLADLIRVSHSDFIRAKHQALGDR
ncbi:MAG: TerB family tellurite resistance protein [Gammaproteobacteria bacterium]|nr:TerB family tellurite resistance protein [Gammaproteobacteria bacterium]